jgi:D-erythro-7,8-dihydroneopterin triphosphate epimerase
MAEKLDVIYIRDLLARCIVGIYQDEREKKQDVIINVAMECDLREAGRSDDISHTVNYKDIKQQILQHVESSQYFLIERMAEAVADICLANGRVQAVQVTIDKPGALRFARSVAVSIHRGRTG